MITELQVQILSLERYRYSKISPLTGFFGANSSGKTSILQVLLMLKQTVERTVDESNKLVDPLFYGDEDSLVNLINFDAIIHGHQQDLRLGFSVSWKLLNQIEIEGKLTDFLSFSTSIKKYGLNEFHYRVDDRYLKFDLKLVEQTTFEEVRPFNFYGVRNRTHSENFFHLYRMLLKTYFLKFGISVHYANIPDTVILGRVTIQKTSDSSGNRLLTPYYQVVFDFSPLMRRY